MGTPKSFKTLEIEQQCRYGFTKDFILSVLNNWSSVKDYAFICHDKDIKEDGTPKEPHIHLMLRFNDSVPTTAILAKFKNTVRIGNTEYNTVNENNLERMKKWNSAIAYLTHSNDITKYQYSDNEVVSNYNWLKDKEKALSPIKDERLKHILELIDNETIREYNYNDYISGLEYNKYRKNIENGFKYVSDRNRHKGANRNMQVMYLCGASGTGKTTYAKEYCEQRKYSYFVSSGSNDVLDGYEGQDAIILDDLRPSVLGLSDLLKFLDNNTDSTIKSRYFNKSIYYCKCIIITSVLPLEDFYKNVFVEQQEPIIQFKRRCQVKMEFSKDLIETFMFNKKINDYVSIGTVPNAVLLKYADINDITEDDALETMQQLFGGLADMTKAVIKIKNDDGFIEMTDEQLKSDMPF